jgi:hypothetical protein
MRHKLDTIVFSQGWLANELANAANDVEKEGGDTTIAKKVLEQWQVIDEGIDDLIKENRKLTRRLAIVESAFSY